MNHVLETSIFDEIEKQKDEAYYNVLEALINESNKSLIILENYNGSNIDDFKIIQEGAIMDDVKKQGKGQGKVEKAFTFLFRLIRALVRAITGKLSPKAIKIETPSIDTSNPKFNAAKETVKSIGKPVLFVGGTYMLFDMVINKDRMSLKENLRNAVSLKEKFENIKHRHDLDNAGETAHEKKLYSERTINELLTLLRQLKFESLYIKPVTWGMDEKGNIIFTNGYHNFINAYNRLATAVYEYAKILSMFHLIRHEQLMSMSDPGTYVENQFISAKQDATKSLATNIESLFRLFFTKDFSEEVSTADDVKYAGLGFKTSEESINKTSVEFEKLAKELSNEVAIFKNSDRKPSEKMINELISHIRNYYDSSVKIINELGDILGKWHAAIDAKNKEVIASISANIGNLKKDNVNTSGGDTSKEDKKDKDPDDDKKKPSEEPKESKKDNKEEKKDDDNKDEKEEK